MRVRKLWVRFDDDGELTGFNFDDRDERDERAIIIDEDTQKEWEALLVTWEKGTPPRMTIKSQLTDAIRQGNDLAAALREVLGDG